MKIDNLNKKTVDVCREIRFLRLILMGMTMILLIAMVYIVSRSVDTTVNVSIPPNLTKSFWIKTHGDFNAAYLEQMGTFISYLVLNATAESIGYQANILKPYLAPEAFGKFETDMKSKEERMKKYQISTSFHPNQIYLSKSGKCRIQISGKIQTFVGGTQTKEKTTRLNIDCENVNGRFYVTGIALSNTDQL